MPDSWQNLWPIHRAVQTLACNHLNIPGACKQRTPSIIHTLAHTYREQLFSYLCTKLAAWHTNLQCTRLTVHQHAMQRHHCKFLTDTRCCTSSALSNHDYRSRWGLHLNLDRSWIVFSISATASSTCSACRSTLKVLLTSAFLQKAPHFLSSWVDSASHK